MAKLYFSVEADYQKVIRLREEIAKLEKQMKGFNSHTSTEAIEKLQDELKDLRSEYGELTKKAAKSGAEIERASLSMSKALAAIGGVAALKSLGSEIIRVRGEFQEMETAIETLVGKKMSDKLIPQIKELAKVSPLTMTDIVGAEKMMLGFNIEADKTIGFLKALSDVSMGSSQKFNSLTLAFSQMSASGKLMGQDLNQMINAGFNPLQQISQTTGKSIAKLKEEMSKGAISAEMVQKAFIDATSAGGKFYKMSEYAAKTINGQISMMQDAWDAALNKMGTKSEGFIMSGIQTTTSLIQNYETIGKVLVSLVATYGTYKAALMVNIALEKAQAVQRLASIKGISTMSAMTGLLTKKVALLNAVSKANPYVLLATAIIGVATAMWTMADNTTAAEKAMSNFEKRKNGIIEKEDEHKNKLESLIQTLNSEVATESSRRAAMKEMEQSYESLFKKYVDEKGHIQDLTGLWKDYNTEREKASFDDKTKIVEDLQGRIRSKEWELDLETKLNNPSKVKQIKAELEILREEEAKWRQEVLEEAGKLLDGDNADKNKSIYKQDYEKAKKEWEDAKKELAKIEKDKEKYTTEQYNTAKKKVESTESSFKALGGKTDKQIKQEENAAKKEQQQAQKNADELLSMRRKNQQDEINLMKEGSEKKIAQINLDYQKELDEIEKQKKEWETAQGGKLTDEQNAVLNERSSNAFASWVGGLAKEKEERIKAEKEANYELIKLVGDYEQQKQAIKDSYAEKKKETDIQAEKDLLDAQMEQELEALDEKFGYATSAMADLFEDASNKSVNAIQEIIDKYETLVKFMSGSKEEDGTSVTVDELKGYGFTDKDIEKIKTGAISIKEVTERIKELKGEVKGKSPFKSFTEDLKEGFSKLKDSKTAGEGIAQIGKAVSSFAPQLKEFSSNIGNIFGFDDAKIQGAIDAVDGLGQTAAGVGQIMSGDVVGGAMAAVGGISQMVDALDGMFGADYSNYNRFVEEYTGLIDVWDKIIDRKREYVDISYGDEARAAGKEALDLLGKEAEAYKTLGKERLNSGASAGSHSIGIRQRKRINKQGWSELRDAANTIGFDYNSVASGRMTGLFDLSAEQLEKLQEQAPTFWAKLDENVREYLENIIASNDEIEEMKDLINETMTGVSFDSFYDNFVSTLMDMDASSKDFADNFEEYLKTAIISNLIANKYKTRIEDLYNSWANKSDSNGDGIFDLTAQEAEELKNAQQSLADEMIAERDAMKDAFGWSSTASQEASGRGFETMSQDTANELNGRFTALQIAGEEIERQVTLLNITTNDIKAIQAGIKDIAGGIQDQLASSYLELVAINENTGASAKYLKDIKSDIAEVKENTKNL